MDKGRKVKDEPPSPPPHRCCFMQIIYRGLYSSKVRILFPAPRQKVQVFFLIVFLKSTKKGPENAENQK